MPLPNLKVRCTALCRARGAQCWNPAAFSCKTCVYHGAKKPQAIKSGAEHGRYKSGDFTHATKLAYRLGVDRLLELEAMAFNAKLIGRRKAGRKPTVNRKKRRAEGSGDSEAITQGQ